MADRSSPHPGVIDPAAVAPWERALGPIVQRMWPASFHDLENLPEHHRVLIVANHSGMGTAELMSLSFAWYGAFGASRPVAGMAHPAAFRVPVLRDVLHGLGAVEATREGAATAIRHGVPLLLFPGGDHEAARPVWQADRVDFAGRKGWIRLAREHGLAIVPLCISGSHVTLPVLARGRTFSWLYGLRLIGVHRAPLSALSLAAAALAIGAVSVLELPIVLGAATAWAAAVGTMMVPWIPSQIGFHVLPPIPAEEVGAAEDDALYDRVVGALQHKLREANAAAKAPPIPPATGPLPTSA